MYRSQLTSKIWCTYCEESEKWEIRTFIDYKPFKNDLTQENGEISLYSIVAFTEQQCGGLQFREINRFSALEGKWLTDKFLDPRIENFHGCKLLIGLGHNELPFLKWEVGEDGKIVVEGALVKMVEALSVHFNFKFSFVPRNEYFDLLLDANIINMPDTYSWPLSDPIFSTSEVFIVPPGESYTPWEKLLLPFDEETWMWLGITFAIASLVVFLILLTRSVSMHDFVIGSNVTTPSLNIFGIIMGVSQKVLPRRNVSRFLFTCFILFCLIMRTAYQGKYFDILTGDVRKKPVTSLEELTNFFTKRYFSQS